MQEEFGEIKWPPGMTGKGQNSPSLALDLVSACRLA
jgi:hypothetical protein